MDAEVLKFTGQTRRRKVITAREKWDQRTPSDLMVWEICLYTRTGGDGHCYGCPATETDPDHGEVKRGCRGMAEEACRTVFAVQAREPTASSS